jgi:hypothetical protein
MPYIKAERRKAIWSESLTDYDNNLQNAGELNYFITDYIVQYLETHGLSYQTCNDIVGALECCKQEFIRRVVNNYENKKIKENGDVYPKHLLNGNKKSTKKGKK